MVGANSKFIFFSLDAEEEKVNRPNLGGRPANKETIRLNKQIEKVYGRALDFIYATTPNAKNYLQKHLD